MAGGATPTSSAGHPSAGANTTSKLTFKSDHQSGAGHGVPLALRNFGHTVLPGFHSRSQRKLHTFPGTRLPAERSHRTFGVPAETPSGISSANRKLLKQSGFFL